MPAANAFWPTQSVPLASMLLEATRSSTVWCCSQGSGLLLLRRERHCVYCPRRLPSSQPTAPLQLGPPHGRTACHFVHQTSAVSQSISSPVSRALVALLGMSNCGNKHRMKAGRTRDVSKRNTMVGLFPITELFHNILPHFVISRTNTCIHACTRARTHTQNPAVNSSQNPVPFFRQKHEWVNISG